MTVEGAFKEIWIPLQTIYEVREARNIAGLVIEQLTGFSTTERILQKQKIIDEQQQSKLTTYIEELLTGKPVQYVLGEAWFGGLKFIVNENVLIPRPETEELVEWMVAEISAKKMELANLRVLDIGTGSGCIAILLKSKLPQLKVTAMDVSEKAIEIAKKNAGKCNTPIEFICADILIENCWNNHAGYDYIISNPPYIKKSEAAEMEPNVLNFEPETALFVPEEDPLLFYRKIIDFSKINFNEKGSIFFEVNENHAKEVKQLFISNDFKEVMIKNDFQGKPRMVKGKK